jgi:hypothetical protein
MNETFAATFHACGTLFFAATLMLIWVDFQDRRERKRR